MRTRDLAFGPPGSFDVTVARAGIAQGSIARRRIARGRAFGRSVALAALVAMVPATVACAPEPARAPHEMRPVAKDRAADVMGRVFRARDLKMERNRVVHLARDKEVRLAVAAAEHKFGVAYLTDSEVAQLGDSIPPRPEGSDALVVVRGAEGARVLVLFERDYVEDDLEGEEHTQTTIAAERRIERDVRDFLYKATQEGWP